MKASAKAALAAAALAMPATASASDTVTYSYDALGRLVAVATTGGPNDSMAVSTGYDRAGNRSNYSVAGTGNAPPPGALPSGGEFPSGLDDLDAAEGPVAPSVPIVDGIPQEEEAVAPEAPEGEPPPPETLGSQR